MKNFKIINGILIIAICLLSLFSIFPILKIHIILMHPTGTNLGLLVKSVSSMTKIWERLDFPQILSIVTLYMTIIFALSILILTIFSKLKDKNILNTLNLIAFIGFFVCFNLFFMAFFSRQKFSFSLALFFKNSSIFGYLIEILAIAGISLCAINSKSKINDNGNVKKYKGMHTL